MNSAYVAQVILAMAVVTFALRAVPFVLPKRFFEITLVQRSAKSMPLLIMILLVLNAFDGATFVLSGTAIPLLGGIATVAVLQLTLRVSLVSIIGGVAVHILTIMWLQMPGLNI